MGKFNFFWKRGDDKIFEFQQNAVLNQQQADGSETPDP